MEHNAYPAISVVIPYFNREKTLLRALDSVRNQTEQDFEIITVDDGSSDSSFELVERYRQEHPELAITNIRQPNGGPSAARNNGVRHSKGEYIAFLDSDDSWAPEKLARQYTFMRAHPEIMMTGTNYAVTLDSGKYRVAYAQKEPFVDAEYTRMLFKVFFAVSTLIVSRKVFTESNIWFREGKNQGEDILFFLQVVRCHPAGRLGDVLTYYYKEMYGQGGLTADLKGMLRNDMDNIRILVQEEDSTGSRMNVGLAGLLAGYTLLKHVKRIIRSELQ